MPNAPTAAALTIIASAALVACDAGAPDEMLPADDTAAGVAPSDTVATQSMVPGEVALTVYEGEEYDAYIADSDGRALYLFMQDTAGTSTCYDACAEEWPPLLTQGPVEAADSAVRQELIDQVTRSDGATQVKYGEWPLYYYHDDAGAGDTKGQDVAGFGAEWYLVSPAGEAVEGHGESGSESS